MRRAVLKRCGTWLTVAGMFIAGCGAATAADVPAAASSPHPDQWQYSVTIYGYFPSIHGTSTFPNGTTGPTIRLDAHTILANLNAAFMGRIRAQKGAWGMLADWIYADIGDSATAIRTFNVPGVPIPVGITGNFKLRSQSSLLTLAGTHELVSEPRRKVDLVFGVRMDTMQQKLDWQLSAALPGLPERAGQSRANKTNWDAIVGLMGRERFARDPRWFIPYYVDAGTGDSRFTGQAAVGIGYAWAWGETTAGWRYIDYRFKSGSLISSTSFSGPAVGLTWRF